MRTKILSTLTGIGALATVLVFSGCDTEPSTQAAISISPNAVDIRIGESQEFTASGWQDYTWEITGSENTRRGGVLSSRRGDTVIYTAVEGTNNIIALRVSAATVSGSTNGSSEVYAEALIRHIE